ncbi:MAG: glycoside hydrolase family 3 C-terminal domain-containing protein [Defluviitaleaceae bacterium]|nr:glycoside hydrolase family 3 C-terminal domain-containing protein [Defluviitaleaceae bacterium]MCL2274886.1 glycoside hydrolase family 3 C-terminal domain-containing protein [Defluviitaleaceae bacterium]
MTDAGILSQELKDIYGAQGQGSREVAPAYQSLIRRAAGEGIVMLKNDGALPLSTNVVSVFGRIQVDYFYVGNGSGGDVKSPYFVNLMQGLENNGRISLNRKLAEIYADWCTRNPAKKARWWGDWVTHHEEMPLTSDVVKQAREASDTALVVIGRCAGEDGDSSLQEGSFYLTQAEKDMLDAVTSAFDKTVLLINSGNIIDFSWYEKYESKISALLYVWQGGMESGNAIADVLSGNVNPAAKLTTAIAKHYEDYPTHKNFGAEAFNNYAEDIFVGYRYFETFAKEAVLFPFGYGLSYTRFSQSGSVAENNGCIAVSAQVVNTGTCAGAEVVQVYYSAPQGVLGKPARELAAFAKTDVLKAGESQTLTLEFPLYYMASYDDAGKTGHKSAYILEAGEYEIFAGGCVRSAQKIGAIHIAELTVVEQLEEAAAVEAENKFARMVAVTKADGTLSHTTEATPTRTVSLEKRILANLPKGIPQTGDMGYKLSDVKSGKVTLEAFTAQLDLDELEGLTRGDFIMGSPLGVAGNAGVFGGVTESLRAKGVVPVTTTDGPSGIRLQAYCALLPCGLAISSTWDVRLVQELGVAFGQEFAEKGSHVILAPGMNILRDPLCGRNFEYFSEDPVLSGKVAAAMVVGLQTHGKSACPKHFVANNQERKRNINDSRVSERALREIYLKGFEICVKDGKPRNLMTCYNKINGVWGHYHYELCTYVLRGEWGYEGNIVTDWWMQPSQDPIFGDLTNCAYRVRAQVDVLMPGGKVHFANDGDGSLLASHAKPNGITLGEIQRTAMNTLRFVLQVI